MKKTNNALVVIAVIVTVFALANFVVTVNKMNGLTGHVSDTGTANLTVETTAQLVFTTGHDVANWQSGSVTAGQTSATLDTEGTMTNGNWTVVNNPLTLENQGNTDLNVTLKTSNDAAAFLGGTSPSYKLKITDTVSACNVALGAYATTYTDASTSDQVICSNMSSTQSHNDLTLNIELVVPSDSLTGARGSVITATGTSI